MAINRNSILIKVMRAKKTQDVAFSKMNNRVTNAKRDLLEEFNKDPVTVELLEGPDLDSSQVMPLGYGNLFSFLGFNRDKPNPVHVVRSMLENIHLLRRVRIDNGGFTFSLKAPNRDDLEKETPMEWESGRSWINAITYGIGTFSHYMFNLKEGRFKTPSRSGTAIQVATNLHQSSVFFTGRGYVIGMLGRFKAKLTRIK